MSDHPRTIDNGAGEELTFVGTRTDERGEYLEARNTVKPGSGPPMHVHRLQEESLTVERGTMGWQRQGDEEQDNLEYFLTQIYASTRAGGGKRPRTSRLPSSVWCSRSWWPSAGCSGSTSGSPALRSR
jgi:hypothetical protein